MKAERTVLILGTIILLLGMLSHCAHASDRCRSYALGVRKAHFAQFGLDFPYWYGVAQLEAESNCRDILSRDGVGSQGLAQITWSFWGRHLKKAGIPHLKSTHNQLRAQAFIMADAVGQAPQRRLWVAYQIYNGGRLVLKEIERAGEMDHDAARAVCRRKDVRFGNGQVINACDINYRYSEHVYQYAEKYRLGPDSCHWRYW